MEWRRSVSESRDEWKKTPLLLRLRSYEYMALDHICCEAADRIEALQQEVLTIEELELLYNEIAGYECMDFVALTAKLKKIIAAQKGESDEH
jgi:hypothetical protein